MRAKKRASASRTYAVKSGRLTGRAYARLRGLSHTSVQKAIKSGRIQADKAGRIDPRAADRAWRTATDPAQVRHKAGDEEPAPGHHTGAQGVTYAASRADRESFLAKLAELDYRRRSGELLEAEAVRAEVFKLGRRARDMLLALPERLAPRLAAGLDVGECHRILREEVERVANEIAAGARAL
jgi:phage terminase Nu1 subunit (DNA packaging protein)